MKYNRVLLVSIGINYPGTQAALRGCVNDIAKNYDVFSRECDARGIRLEMTILRDTDPDHNIPQADFMHLPSHQPTKQNILDALISTLQDSQKGDLIIFNYSGHGSHQTALDPSSEATGEDQTICPSDFQTAGMITDNVLHDAIDNHLHPGARFAAITDCCHSGTILDLRYKVSIEKPHATRYAGGNPYASPYASYYGQHQGYYPAAPNAIQSPSTFTGEAIYTLDGNGGVNIQASPRVMQYISQVQHRLPAAQHPENIVHASPPPHGPNFVQNVAKLSGCTDNQTSADAQNKKGLPQGAMTIALHHAMNVFGGFIGGVLEKFFGDEKSKEELLLEIHGWLRQNGYEQRPQLTYDQLGNPAKLHAKSARSANYLVHPASPYATYHLHPSYYAPPTTVASHHPMVTTVVAGSRDPHPAAFYDDMHQAAATTPMFSGNRRGASVRSRTAPAANTVPAHVTGTYTTPHNSGPPPDFLHRKNPDGSVTRYAKMDDEHDVGPPPARAVLARASGHLSAYTNRISDVASGAFQRVAKRHHDTVSAGPPRSILHHSRRRYQA